MRKLSMILAFSCLAGCSQPATVSRPAATSATCTGIDIEEILLPYVYGSPELGYFHYYYRHEIKNPASPTVVLLTGGPGGTTIGQPPIGAIPADYSILYIDQRGVGCNTAAFAGYSDTAFKTDYLALDVVSVIKHLGLTNYMIYGGSYGTVHATVTAYWLQDMNVGQPKAVVLEGITGKGYAGFYDYFHHHSTEWRRVKAMLFDDVRAEFEGDALPLGFSEKQWGTFLNFQLIAGDYPSVGHLAAYYLNALHGLNPAQRQQYKEYLESKFYYFKAEVPQAPPRLFKVLGCEELWGEWLPGRRLSRGEYVAGGENICEGYNYSRRYDSADYKLKVPLYYVQGPYDIATTYEQARYHFENQTEAKRYFLTVDKAGHQPLTGSLSNLGCSGAFWNAVASLVDPRSAVAACKLGDRQWPVGVEFKAAQ